MENQRSLLTIALLLISAYLYFQWLEFSNRDTQQATPAAEVAPSSVPVVGDQVEIPQQAINTSANSGVPSVPAGQSAELPETTTSTVSATEQLISVETDLVKAWIDVNGGKIVRMELKREPVAVDQPDQGFPLLKNTPEETFITEDGLIASGGVASANHQTAYQAEKTSYQLGDQSQVSVPLVWTNDSGVRFTKTITFNRDSYIVDINYRVENQANVPWNGYLYAQFNRTEPEDTGGSFGQLPSYTGGAIYLEKYEKIDFGDMQDENLNTNTKTGWVAMIQHYFVGAWIPDEGSKTFFSSAGRQANPHYRIGYKTNQPVTAEPGASASLSTRVYLGSKEQSRLKRIENELGITGLALTVDFGFLTFIADPLFTVLSWINNLVGNWGWSIILLTILIKAVFYPLSAASYKSMAGMKKLQPRMKTLKERYKDDRQKYQMEMMALYKKEKINPAGGCLPILIQIPVFIALYWALLESVELRQAPFALWWQDLSAPDPYYVLPVLMGASMWVMQKLNPAAMDEIQRKVMMIMPIALTFLFLSFPQGLVLYWVVNNILSMTQQWYINKKHAV